MDDGSITDRDLAAAFDADTTHEDITEHFARNTYRGREYFQIGDARHGIERGTALVDDIIVRGFPSIPRVLVLDPGVEQYFDGPVAIEEKLNGYNVRVAQIDGDVLAFTRGGYVCPYTTEFVQGTFTAFFDDYPEKMVCGELIGPENPYTPHEYEEADGVELRVFDLRERESGTPVAPERRYELCETYDLSATDWFGVHDVDDAAAVVREQIADLDERGREGVVMKSRDGTRKLKYTTSAIHQSDLEHAFGQPFDYGREFLFSRVIREAFQAAELDDNDEDIRARAHALGEAILPPMVEAIEAVDGGEPIGDEHTVRGSRIAVESLLAQFESQGLTLRTGADYYDDDERVVEFMKVAATSQDKIQHYLGGGTIDQ